MAKDYYRKKEDLSQEEYIKRLKLSVRQSYKRMEGMRKMYLLFRDEYVGFNHGSPIRTEARRPANDFYRFMTTVVSKTVGTTPQTDITSDSAALRPSAESFRLAVNARFRKTNIEEPLADLVQQVLIAPLAMMKISVKPEEDSPYSYQEYLYGNAQNECIPFTRIVVDMDAENHREFSFLGHLYDLPFEYVKDSPLFKNTDNIRPTDHRSDIYGRPAGKRTEDEWEKKFRVWCIYVRKENRLVMFPAEDHHDKAIFDEKWTGPEGGPFIPWVLDTIPEYMLGIQPAAQLYDLEKSQNIILNKIIRQGINQKYVTLVPPGSGDDVQRIMRSADGGVVSIKGAKDSNEKSIGGYYPNNLLLFGEMSQLFSKYGANLDQIAGGGGNADTLGQDEMKLDIAIEVLKRIRKSFYSLLKKVVFHNAMHLWDDIYVDEKIVKKSGDIEIETSFNQATKRGDFFEYNYDIDPYSLQYRTPMEKLQDLNEEEARFAQNPQAYQAAGMAFDVKKAAEFRARWKQNPAISEVWKSADSVLDDPQVNSPASTTRNYVRKSEPSTMSQQGTQELLKRTMLPGSDRNQPMPRPEGMEA